LGFPKTTIELVNECFERIETQCGRYPTHAGLEVEKQVNINRGWFAGKRDLALDVLYEIRHTKECIEEADDIRNTLGPERCRKLREAFEKDNQKKPLEIGEK